ncbi:uncharacterized protein [Centroberyx affinis]|uniref:uncharacterized protein n=1 Tax=Centroberyx affinis TaxID=166261 RepID=UPI003A5C29ED
MFWLLPLLAVCCFSVGSYALQTEEECYGRNFWLPSDKVFPDFNGKLFFTPTNPRGPKKLVMENRELKDPRYRASYFAISLLDVKERDEGIFSISYDDHKEFDIVKLKVLDCSDKDSRNYGAMYSCSISRRADFLEFTPLHSLDQPRILWNRTDPQASRGGRGQVDRSVWEMMKVTQADNGYYNFRKKDNTLVSRKKLTVTEYTESYERMVNEDLRITFALDPALCTVTFTPWSEMEPIEVMKAGRLIEDGYDWTTGESLFPGRIRKLASVVPTLGFEIDHLKASDSGRFEVRDQNGNLALVVKLKVKEPAPQLLYIVIGVGAIFAVVVCWCCVRRCCCKKSSSKRNNSVPQTAAAPAQYYHDDASQPSGPNYSTPPYVPTYTYEPTRPLTAREPESRSLEPLVPASGGPAAAPSVSLGSDCLSSDPEPRFELKGLSFPSAPPLSSDSTQCDVYTSDKLNFI